MFTTTVLLVILGATAAEAATGTVLVSSASVGRDASEKFTFDVVASADAVQGSGRVCPSSSTTCTFYLSAQLVDGSTVDLQSTTIAWGATFPYSHEFAGTFDTSRVIAVGTRVAGNGGLYSNWTHVTDPLVAPVAAMSSISIGRDAASKLTFDITATTDGVQGVGRVCPTSSYTCTFYLTAELMNATTVNLQTVTIPWGTSFPYSHEFTGTISTSKVVGVSVRVAGYGAVSSNWVPVTDPVTLPTVTGSISLTVNSIGRDASTANLTYDLSVTVLGASSPNGACGGTPYGCTLYVDLLYADGGMGGLTSSPLPFQASYTQHFTGSAPRAKVVAVRANTTGALYGDWVPVTDPYPDKYVKVTNVSLARDANTGYLASQVSVTVSGSSLPDGPCGGSQYSCFVYVQVRYTSGAIGGLSGGSLPSQALYSTSFGGSGAYAKIDAIRAYTTSPNAPGKFYSDWVTVHDPDKSESAGGGNPSMKGCQCHNGDPVNTATGEFYEASADLALRGAGPSVSVGRTYSTLSAAVNGPFGYGTTANFTGSLVVDTAGDSTDPLPRQVHIVQENGATVPFTETSGGTYSAAGWVLATLTHSAATGNWTFTRDKKQIFVFDSSGKLITTSDLHGNTVTYGYASGHVTSISGSGGREIDLTWTSGRVSAIADTAGRAVSYGYNAAGNLTVVDAADNGLWGYTYDSSHRMLTETKPGGGVTTNVYNSTGQVTSQTDPVGRLTTFAYSGATTTVTLPGGSVTTYTFNQGQPASITTATGTPLAATTTYAYDTAGNLVSQTDPLGHTTTYTYDDAGNALTTTDPLGKVTTRTFDSLRDVTSIQDPLGRTTTMSYNSDGDLTSSETPGGHTTSLDYNTDGTVASSTDARGNTTSYTYDSAGRALCMTDPDSRQSCQSNDGRGLPTTKTDAAGKVTTMTYDNTGRVLTVTDPNSHATTYVYDSDGNLTSTQDASGHTATATYDHADQRTSSTDGRGKTTSYTYTPRGSVATVTDPNSHVTTNAYDAQNRLSSSTDAESRVTSFAYDLAGEKISTTLPSTAVSSSTYDANGRVATTTDALGKVTTYAYDEAGELHSTTDPLSRVTTYSYTDDGKLHVTTLPDSSTETYAYNADDVQTSFTNADGDVTMYSYDDAGVLTSETQPGGMTTSYTYDAAGRIHTVTTPDGVVATRTYDDGGRLTNVNYPGTADDVSYTYFANGSRHTMTDGTGTTTYAYNANAALTSVQNGNGQTIGYGYDDASRLTSITYPGSKTVSYGYDNAGNMTSVTDWASRTTTLTVTADGLQNTRTDPSGVTETRSYNANDQLTDISSATSSAILSDYGYGYDVAGQLTSSSLTDAIHTTTVTKAWGYTSLGQLSSTGASTGYTTTPAGELTATPAGDAFTYNSKQELAAATNTSAGTTTAYSYNDNGSRTETAITTSGVTATVSYDYDARGNLTSVTTGGTTVSYQSDGDGLRQSRTVGTATSQFLWDPNHAIPVLLDDGTDSYIYATSTTPIAEIDDSTGAIEYLHADNVGSVRTITSATGTVVGTTDYNPYGVVTSHTGTSTSNFGYATAWTDPGTGLDYLRAREYDPNAAQFLQVDPAVELTRQPYGYVSGDPLNSQDPSGLCPPNASAGARYCQMLQQARFFAEGLNSSILEQTVVGHFQDCIKSDSAYNCAVKNFDPMYAAIDGYANEIRDAENGCSGWVIAGDGLEAVSGVAGTMGIATGGGGLAGSLAVRVAPADAADAAVIVRGGTSDLPTAGQVFSGSQGVTLEEAAQGVPHGTIRATTAGEIRASGGTVKSAPEPTRSGAMNMNHVNVCLGSGPCPFGDPQPNPVPANQRIR